MPGDQSETYSTLEIDETSTLPVATPKITSPDLANAAGKEVAKENPSEGAQKTTICGIRRRTFWILVIIASLALIGVAVGVGVGVTQHTESESDEQSPQQVLNQRGVASTSRLAAANYTDAYGVEHSQVFYQDSSLEIWMSDWNSGSGNWNPFPVSNNDSTSTISPKNGTPITANNWMIDWSAIKRTSDLRCQFLDDSSSIRALWSQNSSTTGWKTDTNYDNKRTVNENSSIVNYIPQCDHDTCDDSDILVYETKNGILTTASPIERAGGGYDLKDTTIISGAVRNDAGTAVATVPIPVFNPKKYPIPMLALYFLSGNTLVEMYHANQQAWYTTDLGSQIPAEKGTQLAAMSQLIDGQVRIQVLMTGSKGGVSVAYWNSETGWNYKKSVGVMDGVIPFSPIASTQSGRVYAFKEGRQIVEWKLVQGKEPPEFELVGPIGGVPSASETSLH